MGDRTYAGLSRPSKTDYEGFLDNVARKGTPERVYFAELLFDDEVEDALCERLGVVVEENVEDPYYALRRRIELHRRLGYDYVTVEVEGMAFPDNREIAADTAGALVRGEGRDWVNEHTGPIASWKDFENYPWPDPDKYRTDALELVSEILPDEMCIVGGLCAGFAEHLTWLFGYENLCFKLYDERDLVLAVSSKLLELEKPAYELYLQFDRVKAVWHSDDMGFKTGLMISPGDTRELVLSSHRELARLAQKAGRQIFLHSCGKEDDIRTDLVDDIGFDAFHSFEDTIELVTDAKREYGHKAALFGGIDVDFLCRADESAIRKRVRSTLDTCLPGGGYCLGTGNSVANYIPLDNYLTMIDEGRLYTAD